MTDYDGPHRIVIVGGGAGGLELATRLGDKLARHGMADVLLIDRMRTHVWKPKLHEIAAGSMDMGEHELDYFAQAHWHHFRFRYGDMTGLDRVERQVIIGPTHDEQGRQITASASIGYDTLVLALGSQSNDFSTPGAVEHAISLDSAPQAARFHQCLLNMYLCAQAQPGPLQPGQLHVCIVGAGATGVELAAELHKTTRELVSYGFDRINPEHTKISLVEAADRILPGLPERFSRRASKILQDLEVMIYTGVRVTAINQDSVLMSNGSLLPAALTVWSAGIKAPDFLRDIDGLETNRNNQLIVLPTLQTSRDSNIFALGDCCSCPWWGQGGNVPPRAQAAHQEASLLFENLKLRLRGKPLRQFRYHDFGSLVSLGKSRTLGNLMGGLTAHSFWIEGYVARVAYLSLYKLHELALHGFAKVALDTIAGLITRRTEPRVKLH